MKNIKKSIIFFVTTIGLCFGMSMVCFGSEAEQIAALQAQAAAQAIAAQQAQEAAKAAQAAALAQMAAAQAAAASLTPEQQAAIAAQQALEAQQAAALQQALAAQALAAQQAQAAAKPKADAAKTQAQMAQETEDAKAIIAKAQSESEATGDSSYVLAGTCTTSFAGSSSNRINNIQVASGHLNGLVVPPGQAVSIDTAITPRTAANGYKMAGVYSGGKTIQGIGGGICQVSSTTYNAVMNAGLTVSRRSSHSMPVHYLPLGQDAAISAGTKDMIFVNTYSTPIKLASSCDVKAKTVTISVYVQKGSLNGMSYKFYAKNTGRLSADSYRDVFKDGVLVGTEYVGHSTYQAHS